MKTKTNLVNNIVWLYLRANSKAISIRELHKKTTLQLQVMQMNLMDKLNLTNFGGMELEYPER